jgi:hypothetical protein
LNVVGVEPALADAGSDGDKAFKIGWLCTVAVGAGFVGDAAFVVIFPAGEDGDAKVVELAAGTDPAQSFEIVDQGKAKCQEDEFGNGLGAAVGVAPAAGHLINDLVAAGDVVDGVVDAGTPEGKLDDHRVLIIDLRQEDVALVLHDSLLLQ